MAHVARAVSDQRMFGCRNKQTVVKLDSQSDKNVGKYTNKSSQPQRFMVQHLLTTPGKSANCTQ